MNNSFDLEVGELMSLSTGLTVRKKDGINCDDVESVGVKSSNKWMTLSSMKQRSRRHPM